MRSTAGHRIKCGGVPPFGDPGITVRLSTPPGLSQIPTSFIGSRCQGIHRAPLETSTQKKPQRAHTHATCVHTPTRKLDPPHQDTTTPHKRGQAVRRGRKKLLDARVHYTVLKQQPPQPAPMRTNRTAPEGGNQHPHTHRPHTGDSDGKGRRACCPRTQQCAKDPTPRINRPGTSSNPPHRMRGRTGATGRTRGTGHESVDVPPMSTRRETNAPAAGRCFPPTPARPMRAAPGQGRCSLERR